MYYPPQTQVVKIPQSILKEGNNLELENIIGYHGSNLKTVQFHPSIQNLFAYCVGGLVIIEDIEDKHKQEFLRGHNMPVQSFCISQSGKLLLSGQEGMNFQKIPESPVILWDLAKFQMIHVFTGLLNGVTNVSISSDDRFIAATSKNNQLMIWNLQDNSIVHQKILEAPISLSFFIFYQHAYLVCWNQIKKAGKYPTYEMITSHGNQIFINTLDFDLRSMQYQLSSYPCQLPSSGLVRTYTSSFINGDHFYVGTTGGELCIFNIPNRIFKAAIPVSTNGALSFAFFDDLIFVGSGDGKFKRLRGQESKWMLEGEVQLDGKLVATTLNSTRNELLVGTSNSKIYRVHAATLTSTLHTSSPCSGINDLNFPNSEQFATIDSSGTITVFSTSTLQVTTRCIPPQSTMLMNVIPGKAVTFSEDGMVVGGWNDGFIRAFQVTNQQYSPIKWEIVNAHKGEITALYVDGNYILSGGTDGLVRIWARRTRQMNIQIAVHKKTISAVFPDLLKPEIIHSCSYDKTVHSYDLKQERKIIMHTTKNGVITDMSQRRDHEMELVTCGPNMPIEFWDCDQVEPVEQIEFPNKLFTLAISPSGRYLAAGSEQGQVVLFETDSKKFLGIYTGHSGLITKLRWSADEKELISVSQDFSICVWNFFP